MGRIAYPHYSSSLRAVIKTDLNCSLLSRPREQIAAINRMQPLQFCSKMSNPVQNRQPWPAIINIQKNAKRETSPINPPADPATKESRLRGESEVDRGNPCFARTGSEGCELPSLSSLESCWRYLRPGPGKYDRKGCARFAG